MNPNSPYRAAKEVAKDIGISTVTLWRWRGRGWIKCCNIGGKPYVDMNSLNSFVERAKTGEFAKAPNGAAKKSSDLSIYNSMVQ